MSTYFDSFTMPTMAPFTSTSTSWMNATSAADLATTFKTSANSTWSWVYNNVLIDHLDRFVYHGLMKSANWTTTQLKNVNIDAYTSDIDWVMLGSMLSFFFITLFALNWMSQPSPSRNITVSLNMDSLDEFARMEGFTKPRRSSRLLERAMRSLDEDICAALTEDGVSARDIRKILLPSYPNISVTEVNSRLYTMLNRGDVMKYRGERPTWTLA
jgi:hypothetical protein